MKKIVFILGLVVALITQAQQAKDLTNWKVTVSKLDYKVGDEIEVIITVNITEGWHLYSSDFDPNCGPIPTTIKFTGND